MDVFSFGHPPMTSMPNSALAIDEEDDGPTPESGTKAAEAKSFAEIYDRNFDFVWRVARRLGVAQSALDDVVQETFLVVHRRLAEPRSCTLRTWIYGITVQIVRNHRRSLRRKSPHATGEVGVDPDAL